MSGKMASAAVGIGGDYPSGEPAHTLEDPNEVALQTIVDIVRRHLSARLVETVRNPHGLKEIERGIGVALTNAMKWHGPPA
ncbi:MAG: hypothetical protein AAB927_01385 [Patescibacteria group bacterium]